MPTITVPGTVDSVQQFAAGHTTNITTHPSTDRPSVSVTLKESADNPATFAKDDVVSVTIATA